MLDRLRNDHAKLKEIGAELVTLVDSNVACDPALLAECRWRLARLLLQHLPVEDRYVYRRLEADSEPRVAAIAKQFRIELEESYARFREHTDRWTGEAIVADWPAYAAAVRQMVSFLAARVDREEAQLFPLLDETSVAGPRLASDRNWAGDGWAIRTKIEEAAKAIGGRGRREE